MGRLVELCGEAGGGEGMGAIEKTIQALADQVGSACQVVAICGRNKGLIKRLEAKQYPAGMQVQHASMFTRGAPNPALKLLSALARLCLQAHSFLQAYRMLSHLHWVCCNVLSLPRLNHRSVANVSGLSNAFRNTARSVLAGHRYPATWAVQQLLLWSAT